MLHHDASELEKFLPGRGVEEGVMENMMVQLGLEGHNQLEEN